MSILLEKGSVILFQGDSVTDCGRSREDTTDLGPGYPGKIGTLLKTLYADRGYTVINRGVSGNRVKDLQERWQEDCLQLRPQLVSILIGINDCWRRYDSNDPTSAETYEQGYRSILAQTKDIGAQIVILEPFVLPYPEDRKTWRVDLDPKIQAARKLAGEFGAHYIPLDGIFATKMIADGPQYYSADGVHPADAGHALIAREWMKTIFGRI